MKRFSSAPTGMIRLNQSSSQARGLVVWIPMLASRGAGVLRDLSGKANSGTLGSSNSWSTRGENGPALIGDGTSNSYIDMGAETAGLSIKTISAWLWSSNLSTYKLAGIAHKAPLGALTGGWSLTNYFYDPYTTWRIVFVGGNNVNQTKDITNVEVNKWHLITISTEPASGGASTLYFDGLLQGTFAARQTVSTADNLLIGYGYYSSVARYLQSYSFLGEVRGYDYVLTADEIAKLYYPDTRWDLYSSQRNWMISINLVAAVYDETVTLGKSLGDSEDAAGSIYNGGITTALMLGFSTTENAQTYNESVDLGMTLACGAIGTIISDEEIDPGPVIFDDEIETGLIIDVSVNYHYTINGDLNFNIDYGIKPEILFELAGAVNLNYKISMENWGEIIPPPPGGVTISDALAYGLAISDTALYDVTVSDVGGD